MSFPGIPDDALAALEDPNPLDIGILRKVIEPLASPPDAPLRAVLDYSRLLLATNTIVNLTGARDWETLIEAHLFDCLTAAQFVPDDARVIADWGSGGGLPGLVWASVFPDKRVLLCERRGKRAEFLEEAVMRLELFHAEVLSGQAEEQLRMEGEIDLIVARAVEAPLKLLKRIRRNKVRFGTLFLMAGPRFDEEWDSLQEEVGGSWKLAARHPYQLPGGRGSRQVVVLKPA